MTIETQVVETIEEKAVTQIKLTNNNGIEVDFLTLGATWQAFYVPSENGNKQNLIIGFDKPSDYLRNTLCAGQSIGRVAGRIDKGQVVLDGQKRQLPQNEQGNCLHGGFEGFHKHIWDYETRESENKVEVIMTYRAREVVDGFPGDMTVEACFSLDDNNRLSITYTAKDVTAPTLFNPTNHVYFNLGSRQDLLTHELSIDSHHYLKTREDLVPTGDLCAVEHTDYDLRQGRNLGQVIQQTGGLDDTFIVQPTLTTSAATLADKENGHTIKLYSDRTALVVYTMGSVEEGVYPMRDNGKAAKAFEAVALEAQYPPDAPNHADFGDIIIRPDETKTYTIMFAYELTT